MELIQWIGVIILSVFIAIVATIYDITRGESDESIEKEFTSYRTKIACLIQELKDYKKTANSKNQENKLIELANLKVDFIQYYNSHAKVQKGHPLINSEWLSDKEWEAYKESELVRVSEFWRADKEKELELRKRYLRNL